VTRSNRVIVEPFDLSGFSSALVAYALRISVEEKVLFLSLGEEYWRYAERTKRLISGIF
jgi:protein-S-isoprenylcysteine O-methyltransferase Ste14